MFGHLINNLFSIACRHPRTIELHLTIYTDGTGTHLYLKLYFIWYVIIQNKVMSIREALICTALFFLVLRMEFPSQACSRGIFYLFMEEVQGKLEADCLHVSPLEGGGDVHVHVQEPGQGIISITQLMPQLAGTKTV